MKRVLLAMSGGVDSSTAGVLLTQQGFEVVGCSMQLWDQQRNLSGNGGSPAARCCSPEDTRDARRVAEHLGFPFYVLNLQDEFQRRVVEPFVEGYLKGQTPIPCTLCNTFLKFDSLLSFARKVGIEAVATGHYARIEHNPENGFLLFRGKDRLKDQSYFLFELSQEQLSRIVFPIGEFDKARVRRLAEESGLITATKPESQEICFIPDGDYAGFIRKQAGKIKREFLPVLEKYDHPGPIYFKDGIRLGTHPGIYHFTVGQRRGLRIAHARPLYVLRLDVQRNALIVGYREDAYSRGLRAERVNWLSRRVPRSPLQALVRVRATHQEGQAEIRFDRRDFAHGRSGSVEVTFARPQLAVTPGQAAVFYEGERVVGGGWISAARQV